MKKMLLNSKSGSLWAQLAVFVAAILMTAQVKAENVAQIVGGGSYATVQSAINAAQSGQTVKMLANSIENITVTPGKKLTLDLNGKILQGTGSGSVITVQAEGCLALGDSSEETHCFVEGSDGSWTWSNSLASGNFKTIPAAGAVVAVEGSTLRAGKGLLGNLKTLGAKYGNSKAVFAMFDDISNHIASNSDVKTRRVKAAADYGTPLVDDNPLPTQEDQSNEMWFGMGYTGWGEFYGFDIRGRHNDNTIQTTYANLGYSAAVKVDNGCSYDQKIDVLGKVYIFDDVQVKQHISLADNGQTVKLGYTIHNNTDAVHTVRIGNHTDVQIGDNDYAAVYLTNNHQRISMTDTHTGCYSAGLKYTIDADQDTPFRDAWIGYYYDTYDEETYFYEGTSTANQTVTGTDSGLCFHWTITLQPGQTTQVWCYFQIAPALVIEAVNLTADAETNKVLFDIPYKDLKDRTQTLYYTLENNPQQTQDGTTVGLPVDAENFAHSSFTFSAGVTGWPSNTMRRIDLYAKDNAGYTSKYYTFYIWWPEWSPEKSYSIVSFKNTVNKFADVRGEVGSTMVLPEDASEEGVKEFIGWNTEEDGGGTGYKAGVSYTFTDNDIVLYAQWKYAADRLTYINEDQYYTGAPIEKIKVKFGTQTLTPGVDYNIVYENNINVGTATATVSGGKILGTQVLNFKIMKNTNVVPPTLPGQPYTGGPQIADIVDTDLYKVTVNEGGTEITPEGEDGYPVIISLKDPTQSTWSDGTTEPKTIYFKIVTGQVQLPEIASKPWTGELQTADITDTDTYTVTANAGGTEVGSYIVKVDLKDKTKFKWSNGSTEEQTLTFNITKVSVPVPEIASKVYNAAVQTADVTVTSQFTVTQNAGGTDAGTYDVKLKLTDEAFVHYKWANTDNQETTVDFIITKADNEWITEPSIADIEVNTSAVVTPVYEAKYGTPEITYTGINGKAYGPSSTKPTELGDYRATFKVENANYSTLTKYVDFSIYQLVCAIGDTKYKSVKVASEDVLAGESIKLLLDCNIIEGSTVTLPLGAMIDLNGKTLTNDGTIQVDMTGATENRYKVITGKTPLTAADCGNVVAVNTPDGMSYVPVIFDNELFLVKCACRIGDDYYNTIDLAIEAVKPGETIILLTNITMENSLQLPAGTGLDLNGFTLTDPTGLDLSWDLTKDVAPVVFDFDKLAANGTLTLNVNDQQTLSQYTLAKDAAGATGKQFILKGAATADGKDRVLEVGADKKMFYGHRFYSLALDGTDIVLTVEKVKPQNFEFWGVSVDGTQLALTSDVNYNATHVRDDFYPEDAITHFIFDGDITRIGRYCLENNLNLKEVYFPEVTDYVSLNAFNGCENLEYVSTGEGLVEINDRAFHGCTKLNTIDIADNAELKEIADEAFAGTGFVTMTLPASVEYIGSRTFFGAENLESVTLLGTDPEKINMTHESFKKDNDGTLPAASIFVVSDKLLPFEAYNYGNGINFQTKYERLYPTGILQLGFFSHHNFIVPEGLEAYAATWDGRSSFVLSTTTATAGEVLEGGHGYIFMGAEGTYTFETTAKEPTFTFAANDLIGSPEEVTAKDPLKLGRVFVVNNGSTFDSLVEVTDPAQKIDACHPFAIITPNNAPAVKYFDFDNWYNGWATGVQSPSESTANSDEPTYNVAGQRISSSYKGIVIKNGKKQLNK